MPKTTDLSPKVNIKQPTAADKIAASQPVINRPFNIPDSTAGQTVINLPFLVDTNNAETFLLFVNGGLQHPGSNNDFQFTSIDGAGYSSQVTMNVPMAAGLSIQPIKLGSKKEREFLTDSRFTQIYAAGLSMFQGMVDETSLLTASTSPGAGQFRSSIIGRAPINDLANDLRARFGIDRVEMQKMVELQDEFSSTNERVYAIYNDNRSVLRAVGNWISVVDNDGQYLQSLSTTDFLEITFYGTGLNLVCRASTASQDMRASVDGAAEGSNIFGGVTFSAVLSSRNTNSNQIIPVTSGLTLGLHTVKIRNNQTSQNQKVYGVELLTETATINVRPGTAYSRLQQLVSSAESAQSYNSSFDQIVKDGAVTGTLGTRGARVSIYIDTAGNIKKRATATNSASATLSSADHTYEEVIRRYYWREFGAARLTGADDFSALEGSASDRAFTLDDGTTTMAGRQVADAGLNLGAPYTSNAPGNPQGLFIVGGGTNYYSMTFVGTGIDLCIAVGTPEVETYTVYLDGAVLSSTFTLTASSFKQIKIASGLPYGTHTVRFQRNNASTNNHGLVSFVVYGPKKPTLPTGAVELADYYLMADFSAAAVTGTTLLSHFEVPNGVLMKAALREFVYVGSWSASQANNANLTPTGWKVQSSTNTDYVEYTFFGTGIVLHANRNTAGNIDFTASIDGVLNATGTSSNSTVTNLGGGSYRLLQDGGSDTPGRMAITGLTLGLHKVRYTLTATGGFNFQLGNLQVITPVHSPKSKLPGDLMNSLPIGSCALGDVRETTFSKDQRDAEKYRGVSSGVFSSPSTSSTTYVPMPDMSQIVKSPAKGAWFRFVLQESFRNSTSAAPQYQFYVDGQPVGVNSGQSSMIGGANDEVLFIEAMVFLPPGVHHVQAYWRATGGSVTSFTRQMTVEEL